MKVSIQSKKWIKPATPTQPHLHNHQLSSIDQLQPHFFVSLIFRFDFGNETDTTTPKKIARLEESLSEVLTLYYPLAGEYYANDSLVSCQDQGVEFVVASVDCKLDQLPGGEDDKKALLNGLERKILVFTGVVYVQVNLFSCGGVVICFSFNHKVCDMYTVTTFLDAWATTCRTGELDHKAVKPTFNISSLLPPQPHLNPLPQNPQPSSEPKIQPTAPKFVSKRYIFTGEILTKLKLSIGESNEIISESKYSRATKYYTRVELVMAIITQSLANIDRLRRPLLISQPVNLREKVPFSIEEHSCGNFCTRLNASLKLGDDDELLELREVAGIIRSSARSVGSEIEKVRDWNELSEKVEGSYMEFSEEARKGEKLVNVVRFSSWCRFPLYEVDFGWGKPSLVSTIPIPGVIFNILMDYKSDVDDGGIEAWVCMKEDDIPEFQNQQDILQYASS